MSELKPLADVVSLAMRRSLENQARRRRDDAETTRQAGDRPTLRHLGIPASHEWATFATKLPSPPDATAAARSVANAGLSSVGRVVLAGRAGSGKTSLSCAMLRHIGVGWFCGAYWVAKARGEHPLGHGEAPIVSRAQWVKLLVLDDVGIEQAQNSAVAEVIYERHAKALPTIVTTGFGLQDLRNRYGDGIARRIFEGATVIWCSPREASR